MMTPIINTEISIGNAGYYVVALFHTYNNNQ